jgi:ADP-ribosylglycohydrolase
VRAPARFRQPCERNQRVAADTMAAIAGSVAEAWYGGVPESIVAEVRTRLKPELLDVVEGFAKSFNWLS